MSLASMSFKKQEEQRSRERGRRGEKTAGKAIWRDDKTKNSIEKTKNKTHAAEQKRARPGD